MLEKLLTGFLVKVDPLKAMLERLVQELMRDRVSALKDKHSDESKTHFSGYLLRKLNPRLWTLYLKISKVRKGSYMPFFFTKMKRSNVTLLSLVKEAFINRGPMDKGC